MDVQTSHRREAVLGERTDGVSDGQRENAEVHILVLFACNIFVHVAESIDYRAKLQSLQTWPLGDWQPEPSSVPTYSTWRRIVSFVVSLARKSQPEKIETIFVSVMPKPFKSLEQRAIFANVFHKAIAVCSSRMVFVVNF